MIVGVLCLIPFAIDLACRFAARSSRRWILAIVPFAAPFGAGVAIAWDVPPRMTQIPVFAVLSFALASYLVLAAVLAALSEWRPLLADLRALDRGIFSQEQ
jgi:hypothetical protein